ncbi:hypothetical protein LCGC14_2206320, partial [marine sediment metagenome]
IFPVLKKHYFQEFYHGHTRPGGMFATHDGHIYVAAFPGYRGRDQKEKGMDIMHIGPDGTIINRKAVFVKGATVGGLAVDRAGNIYLGVQIWPKEGRIPPKYARKLPPDTKHGHPSRAYKQHGTIIKFPPSGGRIVPDPAGKYIGHAGGYAGLKAWSKGVGVKVEGALWIRRAGYVAINGHEVGCQCESTRFDVDDYGRVFVPDLFGFRVTVLDTAGNELTHFGKYGNMDNRGPKSARPVPAIPLGWPITVELSGPRAYVADLNNRRIVVAKLGCATTKTCPVN